MVRLKARYLLCEVQVSDRSSLQLVAQYDIYQALRNAVFKAHGEFGSALFGIGTSVVYLNAYTGIVILRFRKAHYQLLWSALPFISHIMSHGNRIPCFFNCIHVGGTIRTCQKFLIRYNRQQLFRLLPLCKTEEEKWEVRKAVLRCSLNMLKEDDEGEASEEETRVS